MRYMIAPHKVSLGTIMCPSMELDALKMGARLIKLVLD